MRLIKIILLLLITIDCYAEPIDVGNKKIEFPNIDGYSLIDKSTQQFSILDSITPSDRKLICVYVPSKVASEINNGKVTKLDNYILCKSHPQTELKNISKSQFRPLAQKMTKSLNQTFDKIDFDLAARHIEDRLRQQKNVDLNIDFSKPKLIKEAIFENDIVSFTILSKIEIDSAADEVSDLMIGKYLTAIIKGKIMYIGIYGNFDNINAMLTVEKLSDVFMTELLKKNEEF